MGGLHPGNRLHAIAQHKGSADLNNIQVWCDPVNDLHSLIQRSGSGTVHCELKLNFFHALPHFYILKHNSYKINQKRKETAGLFGDCGDTEPGGSGIP